MPAQNPMDIAIATLIDKDLKSCAASNAKSACEAVTPELRQAFAQISQEGIQRQARLAGIMAQKGWYVPPQADQATINSLMPQLQAATQGIGATGTAGATVPGTNPARV